MKVCILDYGSGNVSSVANLISFLGHSNVISNEIEDLKSATHLILPGVGAFGSAMENIVSKIPIPALELEVLKNKKPFLGICVGMQVLLEVGYEYGEHAGLGWVPGTVERLQVDTSPLPHIGWNNVEPKRECPLFKNLDLVNDFYFVHSFCVKADPVYVTSETIYDYSYCSSIQRDNIFGVQFHPEKSQKAGQQLINNFLGLS